MVVRIGHVTPSSNTVLEPLTSAMNRALEGRVTHHFGRVRVRQISLSPEAEAQFHLDAMRAGADLLADAPLDAIVWNGTSASWRGLDTDLAFCEAVHRDTGLPVTTTTIAFHQTFRRHGWTRIGLAVPYTPDITLKIGEEYRRHGFSVVQAADLSISDNVAFGALSPETLEQLIRDAAKGEPDCIAVVCTNLAAAPLVERLEAELGIPIVDSVAVTFRAALALAGIDEPVAGWGRLLAAA